MGNDTDDQTTSKTTAATSQTTSSDDAARIADLNAKLAQHNNNWQRLAESQHSRIFGLRQRAQKAEAEAPKDDETIVKKATADLLKTYKGLGTPEEIQGKYSELAELVKYQMVSEAAQVAGMNPKVLSRLLPGDAVLEIGEATDDDGNAKQIVTLREGETKTNLDRYAQTNWPDFLPALSAQTDDQQQNGQEWIQQQGSTQSDASGNKVNPILKKKLEEARERALPQKTS